MKNPKRNIVLELLATIVLVAVLVVAGKSTSHSAQPAKDWTYYQKPQPVRCTCYIEHGITASGIQTRNGIIAGRKEWLGMAAVLYEVKEDGTLGDFIGYYEFCDTGAGIDTDNDGIGDTIETGNSVDVWRPNMESARAWIKEHGDYVYMQIVPAVGQNGEKSE